MKRIIYDNVNKEPSERELERAQKQHPDKKFILEHHPESSWPYKVFEVEE